ncbi:sensor histidine kinase [Microbispora hainanensis]|uniref:histidine kinase n=1 Tax=Microbispora hainanensis TaxID=568844 RepID=A0ABZ1SXE7_9ACTN|nr:sensor histidine kinase [Microbispora hainanensis]
MERMAAWRAALVSGGARPGGGPWRVAPLDVLFAAVLGVLAALGTASALSERGLRLDAAGCALVGVAAAGLVARRAWPLAALVVTFAATIAFLARGHPYAPVLELTSVAVYSAAAWRPERVSGAALAAVTAAYLSFSSWTGAPDAPEMGVPALAALWLVAPWTAGVAVRAYRRVRTRAAEAERLGHVQEERLRMAREVHDIVGHSLAVINMQAGVALHVLHRRPERAEQSLQAMRELSAQALEELRVALRSPPGTLPGTLPGTGLAPVPGLDRVPEIVEAVRRGGLAVDLVVEGTRSRVPAAVDLAGYRIVQESLTNVVRHAGASRAEVRVAYGPETVSVTVTDDGTGGLGHDGDRQGSGHGLPGMRERAASVGGTLEAGPGPGGGFRVLAVLPRDPRPAGDRI